MARAGPRAASPTNRTGRLLRRLDRLRRRGPGHLGARLPILPRQQHDDGVDHEADQRADDGAVDADVLEVAADVELDALGGFLRIPTFDGVGDDAGDLGAEALGQITGGGGDPVIDAAGEVRVRLQAFGEFADELPDAGADFAAFVDNGLAQQLFERFLDL